MFVVCATGLLVDLSPARSKDCSTPLVNLQAERLPRGTHVLLYLHCCCFHMQSSNLIFISNLKLSLIWHHQIHTSPWRTCLCYDYNHVWSGITQSITIMKILCHHWNCMLQSYLGKCAHGMRCKPVLFALSCSIQLRLVDFGLEVELVSMVQTDAG